MLISMYLFSQLVLASHGEQQRATTEILPLALSKRVGDRISHFSKCTPIYLEAEMGKVTRLKQEWEKVIPESYSRKCNVYHLCFQT